MRANTTKTNNDHERCLNLLLPFWPEEQRVAGQLLRHQVGIRSSTTSSSSSSRRFALFFIIHSNSFPPRRQHGFLLALCRGCSCTPCHDSSRGHPYRKANPYPDKHCTS